MDFGTRTARETWPASSVVPCRRSPLMPTLTKPLLSLTAGDLMCTAVVTIPQHTSLKEAAHLLAQAGISGAPVVDVEGRCIGVLSSGDIVSWVDKGEGAARPVNVKPCCVHSNWPD